MQTLAPLVDQLKEIAREEIPAPRTCHIRLYDDHTYRIYIEQSRGEHNAAIVYDREPGEVYWRDTAGARQVYIHDLTFHDTIITGYYGEGYERVVTTIEPPIECEPITIDCHDPPERAREIGCDLDHTPLLNRSSSDE